MTSRAESVDASEQTNMAIAGHVSREMLTHYSHIRQEAKRKAVAALDNVTITSQLGNWKTEADEWKKLELKQKTDVKMVGTGRFELPHCSTPLRGVSHPSQAGLGASSLRCDALGWDASWIGKHEASGDADRIRFKESNGRDGQI
jgi:hypothetical protein